MTNGKLIVVTGATGRQGGAVARGLLQRGWRVRVITRRPNSPQAFVLAAAGMQVERANLNHRWSLARALEGAHAVFSVQTLLAQDVEAERSQGLLLAEAAERAAVAQVIHSSIAGLQLGLDLPGLEAKSEVEQAFVALGTAATIFRPALFMEGLEPFGARTTLLSLLASRAEAGQPFQLLALADFAELVCRAFDEPAQWQARTIDLAGDIVNVPEIRDTFRSAGHPWVPCLKLPEVVVGRMPPDLRVLATIAARVGRSADLAALRAALPTLQSLRGWLAARHPSAGDVRAAS
jgi:uncharacterized protein YbjT (DUF2867 family)